MSTERDTSRTAVKTYVPAYQKERWREHAEALGMSQSEFVRTMVQAGRTSFEVPSLDASGASAEESPSTESEAASEGRPLERRVVEALSSDAHLTWEELRERLTDGFEDRLEAALDSLQSSNSVRYSGRNGGYTLVEGDHGD